MDYYTFFQLPHKLSLDTAELKQRFYANSKKYHPDFFTLDSEENQSMALEKSSLNNQAYKTLLDFDKRLKYFLELHDQLAAEGENQIPQDFLMEMMEFNEKLMELEFDFQQSDYDKIKADFEIIREQLKEEIIELESKLATALKNDEWLILKNFYLKNQYLKRFAENLEKVLPHQSN